MVICSDAKVMQFSEYREHRELFRKRALTELIRIYNKYKSREADPFKWGDEIEYSIVKFDHEKKQAYLLLKAEEFFKSVNEKKVDTTDTTFNIEYSSYQIETTPSKPWDNSFSAFRKMEENLKKRRSVISNYYSKNQDEHVMALTSFPTLGRQGFKWPIKLSDGGKKDMEIDGEKFKSIFESVYGSVFEHDYIKIYPINKNQRTQHKPCIYIPIFIDKNTPQPFIEDLSVYVKLEDKEKVQKLSRPNEIYMDHDLFGWGVTCLQVTFQLKSMKECSAIYDQLAALAPILLTLSASTPTCRGYLTNYDTRWSCLRQSNDDRTDEEKRILTKTRFDDTECYVSDYGQRFNKKKHFFRDEAVFKALIDEGIDVGVANHYANMFLRDPLFVFENNLYDDIEKEAKNFEFLQALNFKPIRYKTPPFEQDEVKIGWRIEFRPLELQFTDYENTAFATMVILLARTILKFNLDFLLNLEEIDANMKTSEKLNACLNEKFHFRFGHTDKDSDNQSKLMTINEIINGNNEFKGLIGLINDYLDSEKNVTEEERKDINNYLKLFKQRANGSLMTPAMWMRKFIDQHPKYKHDSYINEEINYDLVWTIYKIANGQEKCSDLLPEF